MAPSPVSGPNVNALQSDAKRYGMDATLVVSIHYENQPLSI